ncbi:transcription elongation factor GreA [Patescibacteria group bacterium]|nr:transcription elongation factor GreA [Patescibacteria group bacterium]
MNTLQPTIPLTAEFYQQLKTKLAQLTKERAEVMKRLQAAREMGDLSENGAYKYAKFELGSIGRQLQQLRFLLEHGRVVEKPVNPSAVSFGCVVTVATPQKTLTYQLVSQYESNPKEGKLSMESPIGAALMGKKVGDSVTVEIPTGSVQYTVTRIS